MKKFAILAVIAALSVGVLTGCGGGGGAAEAITIETDASGQLIFNPAEMNLKKGTKYDLNFVNKDTAQAHSIVAKDLGLNSGQVAAGQSKKVTFTANKDGKVEFVCDVPGHKESGMVGSFNIQ